MKLTANKNANHAIRAGIIYCEKSAYTYQIFTELGEETCELISSLERYMTYIGDIFKQR